MIGKTNRAFFFAPAFFFVLELFLVPEGLDRRF
jgi:hypothetical protein